MKSRSRGNRPKSAISARVRTPQANPPSAAGVPARKASPALRAWRWARNTWSLVPALAALGGAVAAVILIVHLVSPASQHSRVGGRLPGPVGVQLDALNTTFARQHVTIAASNIYQVRPAIQSYAFVLSTHDPSDELRIYDDIDGRLVETFRFRPVVTSKEPGAHATTTAPASIRLNGSVDIDGGYDRELMVDLRVGAEDVSQVLPLVIVWNAAQQRYVPEALVRQPVPVTVMPSKTPTDRLLEGDARLYARLPYTVSDNHLGVSFRAFGFGSYVFVNNNEIMTAYRITSGVETPCCSTEVEIQLWSASFSGLQVAAGPCQDNNTDGGAPSGDAPTTAVESVPIVVDDNYAEYLRGFYNRYRAYYSNFSCILPF